MIFSTSEEIIILIALLFTVVRRVDGVWVEYESLPSSLLPPTKPSLLRACLFFHAAKTYHQTQENLAIAVCNDLLRTPNEFFSLVRLAAGRIIVSITYGLPVGSTEDKYITHAEKTMDLIGKGDSTWCILCDLLPVLKHLPKCVPFHQRALEGKAMIEQLVTTPFEHVKAEMSSGSALPSLTRDLLEMEHGSISDFEHRVKWTAGAMYGG
ncbi:hypothetical protein ACEPAG_9805 [Sanghuangporus baumii]